MNHDAPRQIQANGKWHYTTSNPRTGTYAIGNCSPWESCKDPACNAKHGFKIEGMLDCPTCNGRGLVKKSEPCPGHATKEEACEHQRQYLISKVVISGPKTSKWPKEKCVIDNCDNEATRLAQVPGEMSMYWQVCVEHTNVESLIRVGESWHS